MLVGDQATFYSPLLTGLPTIDNTLDHVQNAFQLAMYSLRTLGIDADQLEHATSTPSQPHDIHLASDQLDGGDGNDRIIGDDLIVIATPTLGLPVASSDFLDDATRLQSYLYDLRTVAADLENVVFEAHYQVLGQLLQAGAAAAPNLHDLYVGNDTVSGGAGTDTIAGDQAINVMPVIAGVRFDLIRDSSAIDASTWNAVEAALQNLTTSQNAALNSHLSNHHDLCSERSVRLSRTPCRPTTITNYSSATTSWQVATIKIWSSVISPSMPCPSR